MVKLKRGYTDFDSLPLMLNASDLAAIMRISKAGAYTLINSEGFPKTMVGKRVLVAKADLMLWLDQHKH